MNDEKIGQYDLSIYSVPELEALRKQIDLAIPLAKMRELVALREKINRLVMDSGFESLEALFKKNSSKNKIKKSGNYPVKYIHPSDPNLTWTGMGRHPKWLSEWLKAGHTLNSCAVHG
jgi:DNA-binding protein H-NS